VDQFNRASAFGQINVDPAGVPAHASTHASTGSDPITPASIGTVSFLNVTIDINYASIAGGGGFLDSSNITVPGAALDDFTSVNCVSIRGAGDGSRSLLFSAYVSAADTVVIRAINPTAVAVNPGTYKFKVLVAKGI
jgi:hypothetical protein